MFDIDNNKALGPDGFSAYFFKKAWDFIRKDVCDAIKEFFCNGKLLGEVNATIIALVPKCPTPMKVFDFRPIACCNVIYKCISKIITNRFKEGLTKIKIKDSQKFKYHFGCKEIKLTHLCFADNLLMVCNGDKDSLKVVKEVLNEFSMVSGLFPNLSKSTIFFGSITEKESKCLLEVLPFECGKLPMKYLGVPLLYKRLRIKDCQILVDRVVNKVNRWRNKFLSYAGRLQLIASVHVYWASIYLLPQWLIRDIDKVLKIFLWNACESAQRKARISWKNVCKPKENGGLGIRSLKGRNETLSIYDARFKPNAKVAEMIEDGHWIWPNEWQESRNENENCRIIKENIKNKLMSLKVKRSRAVM
uniref:RNA-directed DNA polymerase, eukaryota, reverse transcriptase zinc-binding domain protein n=1 Tax=Tanacetum cinerariifolium TaxID=118510 RepID=A0A699I1Q7_TANCI|nr:RNA-directed DNA polymerase, eukaryota, reverse transcriptase zinc-binding domain protein [Tanacetum cinerariifolium]